MKSSKLEKAREYEELNEGLVSDEARPAFHFSPRVGWLNDPNGLSFYKGKYHLFYQYHPYTLYWGPMHWGHAVSSDLVSWEYLPAALAPDEAYDSEGCFSGSAAVMSDGRHLLMYTGCVYDGLDPLGKGRWRQSQCLAMLSDETGEYCKYAGNPVITADDLPAGGDTYEFRDPYMWRAPDGTYRAVVANGNFNDVLPEDTHNIRNGAQICLYRSDDGFDWSFVKVLLQDERRIGVMWECPSFFSLEDRQVLIASPMDMVLEKEEAIGSVRFPQGNNVCYICGNYDEETETFTPYTESEADPAGCTPFRYDPVDLGLDFYAPQVMTAPDGRRIMIGWMQDPKNANYIRAEEVPATGEDNTSHPTEVYGQGYAHGTPGTRIFGQMTIPRELFFKEGRLCQRPVRELRAYRKDKLEYSEVRLADEERSLSGVSGRVLDLVIDIKPCRDSDSDDGSERGSSYDMFTFMFAKDDEHCIRLSYEPARSLLTVNRGMSGQCAEITAKRSVRVSDRDGELFLRVLLDKWSAEIFVNGGEQTMSLTYFTPLEADGIAFSARGSLSMDITAYTL